MSSKPVAQILTAHDGKLQSLLERALYFEALSHILHEVLDPALAQHITLANLRGDTAVVAADTPAWLTKIRYQAPAILQQLKQQPGLGAINKVQFKVLPPDQLQAAQPVRRANLSPTSAQVLESAAQGMTDPDLADALRRLSRQTSPSQDE